MVARERRAPVGEHACQSTCRHVRLHHVLHETGPENLAANKPVVDLLARVARRKGATRAQVALAWLLAQKPWIVPIPGTRRLDHLEENLGALRVELTSADLQEIRAELSKIEVHGGRMSAKYMVEVEE